jgi:hypothetical protein
MICRDRAASKRPQMPWRALKNAETANSGGHLPTLRVVVSNGAIS